MRFNTDKFVEKLKARLESGIAFSIGAYANDYIAERLARKYLREYAETATGIGIALAMDLFEIGEQLGRYESYLDKIADAFNDMGFWRGAQYKLVKVPLCWFTDQNTIRCINMDVDDISATNVTVMIDDVTQTVASTEGTPEDFTISLQNPVAKGWHKLLVIAGNQKKDSVRRKAYTPG